MTKVNDMSTRLHERLKALSREYDALVSGAADAPARKSFEITLLVVLRRIDALKTALNPSELQFSAITNQFLVTYTTPPNADILVSEGTTANQCHTRSKSIVGL
jgi:hypothetical protein